MKNRYWPYYKKFAPSMASFQPNYLKRRDFKNIGGVEFLIAYKISANKFAFNTGFGYRSFISISYADSIQINPFTKQITNDLKFQEEIKKIVLFANVEYKFFIKKSSSFYVSVGFEKNIESQNIFTISNTDYYQKSTPKPSYQDFENISLGYSKHFKGFSISLPLIFETSYYNIRHLTGYKEIYFYYKTGLIISF